MKNKLKIYNETIIYCPTKELSDKVLIIADILGWKWGNNNPLTIEHELYGKKGWFYYFFNNKKVSLGGKENIWNKQYIYSAEDFLKCCSRTPLFYYDKKAKNKLDDIIKVFKEKGSESRDRYDDVNVLKFYYIDEEGNIDWHDFNYRLTNAIAFFGTELFISEKPKEYKFKPFEKVLVRDYETDVWQCNLYSHKKVSNTPHVCIYAAWNFCIPYEGNEYLLGTTNPE